MGDTVADTESESVADAQSVGDALGEPDAESLREGEGEPLPQPDMLGEGDDESDTLPLTHADALSVGVLDVELEIEGDALAVAQTVAHALDDDDRLADAEVLAVTDALAE